MSDTASREARAREVLRKITGAYDITGWEGQTITSKEAILAMLAFAAEQSPRSGVVEREAVASDIARIAGCQVGSERTRKIVDYILTLAQPDPAVQRLREALTQAVSLIRECRLADSAAARDPAKEGRWDRAFHELCASENGLRQALQDTPA